MGEVEGKPPPPPPPSRPRQAGGGRHPDHERRQGARHPDRRHNRGGVRLCEDGGSPRDLRHPLIHPEVPPCRPRHAPRVTLACPHGPHASGYSAALQIHLKRLCRRDTLISRQSSRETRGSRGRVLQQERGVNARMAMGALSGVTVLDLTRIISGPYGTMLLAYLGADVVKIEEPPEGDPARRTTLYYQDGLSAVFIAGNVGKKSMTLNLKTERGRALFLRLVEKADVVVENFRPGTMDRLGLGSATPQAADPRIIACAISGYGQSGPLPPRPGDGAGGQGGGG